MDRAEGDPDDVRRVPVYSPNVCKRVADHELCPGLTTLYVGGIDLGVVVCICGCHRKPATEVRQ